MKVLLWLMIPVAALIVGIIWAYVISRPAKPAAMQDSMESFSRFRHALASDPASRSARRAHQHQHRDVLDDTSALDVDWPADELDRPE